MMQEREGNTARGKVLNRERRRDSVPMWRGWPLTDCPNMVMGGTAVYL